jgi:hypothetical protein
MRDPMDAPYDFAREKYEAAQEYYNSDEYRRERWLEDEQREMDAADRDRDEDDEDYDEDEGDDE